MLFADSIPVAKGDRTPILAGISRGISAKSPIFFLGGGVDRIETESIYNVYGHECT